MLSSDSHHLNLSLNINNYSTPPTPNRVDYPHFIDNTCITHPLDDPRFFYLASQKLSSHRTISEEGRRKEISGLETHYLQLKVEITVDFHSISPHPIPSHTSVIFKSLPHSFDKTKINLFVSNSPHLRLLDASISFFKTLSQLKYSARV